MAIGPNLPSFPDCRMFYLTARISWHLILWFEQSLVSDCLSLSGCVNMPICIHLDLKSQQSWTSMSSKFRQQSVKISFVLKFWSDRLQPSSVLAFIPRAVVSTKFSHLFCSWVSYNRDRRTYQMCLSRNTIWRSLGSLLRQQASSNIWWTVRNRTRQL